MSPNTVTLTLVDGVRIVVPDSLDLITPYVLREQQDWFEDEIKFLRRALRPGDQVIDIGANYGVYTLSMAKAVGPGGAVWAFEPASVTAALHARSIEANAFSHVTLFRTAVSRTSGVARLALHSNAELNALTDSAEATGERVAVTTLDDCLTQHGWKDVAVVKIDAEGEEANILVGAHRFLEELSPLVQYEVKAGQDWHMDLVQHFGEIGYRSYRLVPGLGTLVPFQADAPADPYLLNLSACKPDRAVELMRRELLVDIGVERLEQLGRGVVHAALDDARYALANTIEALPYGSRLKSGWRSAVASDGPVLHEALHAYAVAQDPERLIAERYAALSASFARLQTLCTRAPSTLRLASLARVARDFGARSVAVAALQQLIRGVVQTRHIDFTEPFLAPCARFDAVDPGDRLANWVVAGALEELEISEAFSSFFTGSQSVARLETIRDLGFAAPEMLRRLQLIRQRDAARRITLH